MAQTQDARFAEAEADVERGGPWAFRDDDAPNPLTFEVTGWSTGHTRFGDAEFLNGIDRSGKTWSVLIGGVVLRKRLVEGLVEEWDDEQGKYVVTETLGKAQVGEVVSLKFIGDGETSTGNAYPKFNVSRKPPAATIEPQAGEDDVVPF